MREQGHDVVDVRGVEVRAHQHLLKEGSVLKHRHHALFGNVSHGGRRVLHTNLGLGLRHVRLVVSASPPPGLCEQFQTDLVVLRHHALNLEHLDQNAWLAVNESGERLLLLGRHSCFPLDEPGQSVTSNNSTSCTSHASFPVTMAATTTAPKANASSRFMDSLVLSRCVHKQRDQSIYQPTSDERARTTTLCRLEFTKQT